MKRTILSILLALMLALTLSMPVFANDVPYYDVEIVDVDSNADGLVNDTDFWNLDDAYRLHGDANADGVISVLDITKVERIIAGMDDKTPGADANVDHAINVLDITKIERIIAGLDDPIYGAYDRQFDMDFDGNVNEDDWSLFYCLMICPNADLSYVQQYVKTGSYLTLEWEDDWQCLLSSVNPSYVTKFTSTDWCSGWLSVVEHPATGGYDCDSYAMDTATAAYKALGYGCLLYANDAEDHAYNIFWMGGAFTELSNWGIVEPWDGTVYDDASDVPYGYRTRYIFFPDRVSGNNLYYHCLEVDYGEAEVSYLQGSDYSSPVSDWVAEEPMPSTFDRNLGEDDD